jgi:hypothetical protein
MRLFSSKIIKVFTVYKGMVVKKIIILEVFMSLTKSALKGITLIIIQYNQFYIFIILLLINFNSIWFENQLSFCKY